MSIDLAKALAATIVVEEVAALCWRERSRRLALVVLVANVATNPAINLILRFAPEVVFASSVRYYSVVAALELAVLFAETGIFKRWGRFATWRRAFGFAASLNAASYFSGFPLDALGFWEW